MNFLLDIILLGICALIIVISAKRGFFRSMMGLVSKIVALIVAYTFTPALSNFLKENFIMRPVVDSISATIRSHLITDGVYDSSKLADLPQSISELLSRYNVDPADLKETIDGLNTTGEDAIETISRSIASPVVSVISTAAAFLLIFVLTSVVLWIATMIINSIFKLPVLHTANTVLGIVFGVVTAILIMFVYSAVVSSLVTSLGSISTKFFGEDVVEHTILVKFFSKHDLLGIVKNIVS